VATLVGLAMWGAAKVTPTIDVARAVRVVGAMVLAAVGLAIALAGVASFRRASTTVNPTKPDSASRLVSAGVYRATRNPMYLGLLFVLAGWAVLLSSAAAPIVATAFVPYMNRFQIAPEERALAAMFGAEYAAYRTKVRRWL